MKWMLYLLCLGCQWPLMAAEQYSKFDCDNLRDRVEFIKKRASSGYDIQQSRSLTGKDLAIIQEYHLHCQHPVDTVRVIRGALHDSQAADVAEISIQDMPGFSANNAIFHGDKAAAWTDFYQVPSQCRKKQLTESEFVFCAEQKAAQRDKFERAWQTEAAAKISTPELTEAQLIANSDLTPQVVSHTSTTAVLPAANAEVQDASLLLYWQALDEQHQSFKWYGLVMLLLMTIAGWLAWRN